MSPLAKAAVALAQEGMNGRYISNWSIADAWSQLKPERAEHHWAALARRAGVDTPSPDERLSVINELRAAP